MDTRRLCGGISTAALFAFAVSVAAQTPQTPTQPQTQSSDKQIIVTGCVRLEKDVTGGSGLNVGMDDEFVLTDASMGASSGSMAGGTGAAAGTATGTGTASETGTATAGTSGTSATAAAGGKSYELTGDKEDELKKYVGQRVEITGTLEHPAAGSGSAAGSATGTGTTGTGSATGTATGTASGTGTAGMTAASKDMPTLKIVSVRALGTSCAVAK
jgi:hypothetical protein